MENNTLECRICSMFKRSPNQKNVVYVPQRSIAALEKVLWSQWNIHSWFITQRKRHDFMKDCFWKC